MISTEAKLIRDSLCKDDLDSASLQQKREQWETASKAISTPEGVAVQTVKIGGVSCLILTSDFIGERARDNLEDKVCIKQSQTDKVIVYCHGGGLEGSAETFRVWGARLALCTGCRVVLIDYRVAPENPFPAAIDDVFSVCRALSSVLDNVSKMVIGADSTGSALGLASMVEFKQHKDVNVVSGFFLSPSIDLTFSGDSVVSNQANDKLVSLSVLKDYARKYCDNEKRSNPLVSPLFADLSHLPPMLVLVDDSELLLDDATRLKNKLNDVGGTCDLRVANGLWHAWPLWGEFPEASASLHAIAEHVQYLN